MTDRLGALTDRLSALNNALNIVKPALKDFYQGLSDEQKAHFNIMGAAPQEGGDRRG